MAERTFQLVLQYDGTDFAGWQVQPDRRTVQGELEAALQRLVDAPIRVTGAGRTDAGVHARGQAVGVQLRAHWTPERLQRALNGQLPADLWVADVRAMHPEFHARFSATARRYTYAIGTAADAGSPFRRRFATPWHEPMDRPALDWCAERLAGAHVFRAFAVRGTAPDTDDHRCEVTLARWRPSAAPEGGDLVFEIAANRFLHHMVRFLVGTMLDVGRGRRPRESFATLLTAATNDEVSPPAPPMGLCLEAVTYPPELYAA
ncbi:MAG: tRNA pseudouridine(38-40) synthase TruA [Gemmatimonadota bacterium]|jgi:tRNA pseudouridine38-40 synthase|nr:tRNA pseudouridine(38-40) synthase TruA [Gemmatimonadota bacterium]MDQ8146949.1 tRNA pseudouridine(38-40) synthase TruA [Gemmatimonadota bacterium]MDQ8148834.1 tRNA pseudouridine(38-40) synthase TruA [Gemmatimonadota bacterium]MDQ8156766.1 tRNA pseudouridine(38-40) synthase TruA [Gemmatimonadota bacterium]MDQ8176582.1 tRNA pseudouridine(38-40) synthase TruA [Gemmatimonadota bacterium]